MYPGLESSFGGYLVLGIAQQIMSRTCCATTPAENVCLGALTCEPPRPILPVGRSPWCLRCALQRAFGISSPGEWMCPDCTLNQGLGLSCVESDNVNPPPPPWVTTVWNADGFQQWTVFCEDKHAETTVCILVWVAALFFVG